ncbi:MAG: rhodanese-like domain-containing protein [Aliidongia sp.]
MTGSYAGDVNPRDAWAALELDPHAVLVDVRTKAEWSYVGLPDLSALDRPVLKIEWQSWPDGRPNPSFVAEVAAAGIKPEQKVLLLCRSGGAQQGGGGGADCARLAALLQYQRRLRRPA